MTQRTVRMSHPDIGQDITVAESAVPIHLASGWAPVDDESADLSPQDAGGPVVLEAAAAPGPDPAPEPDLAAPADPAPPAPAIQKGD